MSEAEEVTVTFTMKRVATVCVVLTTYLAILIMNNLKDPVTGTTISLDVVAEIADTVEQFNVAIGEEPNIKIREMVAELRRRAK